MKNCSSMSSLSKYLLRTAFNDSLGTNDDRWRAEKAFWLETAFDDQSVFDWTSLEREFRRLGAWLSLLTHYMCQRGVLFTTNKTLVVVRRMYTESFSPLFFHYLFAQLVVHTQRERERRVRAQASRVADDCKFRRFRVELKIITAQRSGRWNRCCYIGVSATCE